MAIQARHPGFRLLLVLAFVLALVGAFLALQLLVIHPQWLADLNHIGGSGPALAGGGNGVGGSGPQTPCGSGPFPC
jgi:hypothetical protein